MPTTVKIRRSGTASATPSALEHGEIAINYADGKVFWKNASDVITSFTFQSYALASHTHAASDITSGTLDIARIPTGSSSSTVCIGNDARLSDTRTPTDNTVSTAKIQNDAVTYAKLQNVSATNRILGRSSAGAGDVEELDAATARTVLSVQPTASPAFTGTLSAATCSFSGTVTVTSPLVLTGTVAGNVRQLRMQTSGSTRWEVGPGFDAESGSNVGSTFWLTRWSDSGVFLGTPIAIARATGVVTFESQVLVTAGSGSSGSYRPGLAVSGDDDTGVQQVGGANTLSIVTNGTERVRVNASGNVGIGTQTTTERLNIVGTSSLYQSANGTPALGAKTYYPLTIENFSAGYGLGIGGVNASTGGTYIQCQNFGSSVAYPIYMQALGGEVLIGTITDNGAYLLQVNSQIYATNATIATSDARFKTNIETLADATSVIESLRPVAFDFIPQEDRNFATERQVGLIAQEAQAALAGTDYADSVVAQCGDHLGLAYEKLVPVLIRALQESNARIAALEERLSHA